MQEKFHQENPIETMIRDAFEQYRQQSAALGAFQPFGSTEISNEGQRKKTMTFTTFSKMQVKHCMKGVSIQS